MSQRSNDIKELIVALSKVQAELSPVERDSLNPHFQHRYAGLSALWEACRPLLAKNGLAVVQSCSPRDDGKLELETMLAHTSGQWIAGSLVVSPVKEGPQPMGSAITYARRYGFMAILGISPEDDDAEAAQGRGQGASNGGQRRQNGGGQRPQRQPKDEGLGECPKCGTFLRRINRKDGSGWFLGCQAHPDCGYTANPPKEKKPGAAPAATSGTQAAPPGASPMEPPPKAAAQEPEEMCPMCGNHPADPSGRCPYEGGGQPPEAPQTLSAFDESGTGDWRPQCCGRNMMPRAGFGGEPPFWQCPRCKAKRSMTEEERKRVGL